jgi:hypothetical protein
MLYPLFWKGVLSTQQTVQVSIDKQVGNEIMNRWFNSNALADAYTLLYSIVQSPHATVFSAFEQCYLLLYFTQKLEQQYLIEWQNLQNELQFFSLNSMLSDTIVWRWSPSGIFSIHSLYEWLEYEKFFNLEYASNWNTKIPLKIKIFLWLLKRERVLSIN